MLAHVIVDKRFRSRGVGSLLVTAFESEARAAGMRRVELLTLPGPRGAGPFYERVGWIRGAERELRTGDRFVLYSRLLG